MTWLYVPGTSLSSAPGQEGSDSESNSPCAERVVSLTWRGKQRPPRSWSTAWKRTTWLRRLSGLTLPPSTLALGVDAFIASLPEIHARETASLESGLASSMIASSSTKFSASSMSAGLSVSSERTCRGTRTANSPPSSRHWSEWATALREEYSARAERETAIGESDSSSWPTAKVATGGYEAQRDGTQVLTLQGAAVKWSSPKASDGEKGGPNMRGSKGDLPLPSQAANWASLTARMWKGGGDAVIRADGKSRLDMLDWQAEQWRDPSSSLDPPIAGGSISSTDGPNSNQPSAKRRLNPIFVEALMRWPIGWTDFGCSETGSIQWRQDMRGYLWMLVTARIGSERQGALL